MLAGRVESAPSLAGSALGRSACGVDVAEYTSELQSNKRGRRRTPLTLFDWEHQVPEVTLPNRPTASSGLPARMALSSRPQNSMAARFSAS